MNSVTLLCSTRLRSSNGRRPDPDPMHLQCGVMLYWYVMINVYNAKNVSGLSYIIYIYIESKTVPSRHSNVLIKFVSLISGSNSPGLGVPEGIKGRDSPFLSSHSQGEGHATYWHQGICGPGSRRFAPVELCKLSMFFESCGTK